VHRITLRVWERVTGNSEKRGKKNVSLARKKEGTHRLNYEGGIWRGKRRCFWGKIRTEGQRLKGGGKTRGEDGMPWLSNLIGRGREGQSQRRKTSSQKRGLHSRSEVENFKEKGKKKHAFAYRQKTTGMSSRTNSRKGRRRILVKSVGG